MTRKSFLEPHRKKMSKQTEQTEKKLTELRKKLENSKEDTVKINFGSYSLEIDRCLNLSMNNFSEIKIPTGKSLLTLSEFLEIWNNHRDKFDFGGLPDEVVEQPLKENKEKYPYWNVWFRGLDSRSGLVGYVGGLCSGGGGVRGVRFCRRKR